MDAQHASSLWVFPPGEGVRLRARMDVSTDARGTFHLIEDDLAESWLDEWIGSGIEAIELYLAKHLAFLGYLDDAPPA
jgi:hypothetical protein